MPDPDPAGWRIDALGERCLMVEFGQRVDPRINAAVHAFADHLIDHPIAGVTDVVPAFTTVAVHYRPEAIDGDASGDPPHRRLHRRLAELLARGIEGAVRQTRLVDIPVCYGGDLGPDLDEVASTCGMPAGEVIARHAASPHVVYMLGFAPGFPYMGGLDPRLAMPRRSTPRVRIPPGSVAIAREQSAVYTFETPGGWNLIGCTPLALFTPQADPPTLLRPGDRIRFVPISREAFDAARAGDRT
ncbi:MAG: 5-oxoprolinase subunit PxpB [Burkholderiaceae bacterium]|nr:5-oxoprolinase subunit PxpB [Burkholderiaceae bacterium]